MGKKKKKSVKHVHTTKPNTEAVVDAVKEVVSNEPEVVTKPVIDAPVVVAPAETKVETPQVNLVDSEPIKVAMEASPAPAAGAVARKKTNKYTIITILLVVIALMVVVFQLEKQDRIGTNIFGPMMAALDANAPVAVVNGTKLTAEDLASGVEQLEQAAAAQGLNPEDPQVRAEINSQAVEMMVNTTLLEQAAAENGIVVDDATVNARIDELAESAGGKEALMARLVEFGIDEEQLVSDVTEELTIRALLDRVFADNEIVVTAEEIEAVYESAAESNGAGALPPLAEVSAQIEAQLSQTKEQEALDEYLQDLRADADIELN